MKLSRRTNTIILWLISIGLLVGMVIMFTPTLGVGGGNRGDTSAPALFVNGEPVSQLELARAQQNPIFSAVQEGEVGRDLELLLVDSLVQQEVLAQAAERVDVSNRQVRQAVQAFRERNNVAGSRNDDAYLALIGRSGFDDQGFRAYLREQLRLQEYQQEITEGVEVTDEEVEAYYRANQDAYQTEARIVARSIVVDDAALAEEIRAEAEAGADFAALAEEHSLERADRGGALGAPAGSSEPQPVGPAALPTAVANAAFGLGGEGLTPVVQAGGRYHIVRVEELQEAEAQPLDAIRDEVRADALEAKQAAVLEQHVEELMAEAEVRVAEGTDLQYEDPVVARVGEAEIHASELARATYSNPQIRPYLSPQGAELLTQIFKPTTLERLIELELAYQGASELDAEFLGSKGMVAQAAMDWVSRDATVTEEDLEAFYEANRNRYVVPASADVTRVDFADQESATAFRSRLLEGAEVEAAASEAGGEVQQLGTVQEGDLQTELDAALFATDAFAELPGGGREVSDVLVLEQPADTAAGEEPAEAEGEEPTADVPSSYVVLVAARTPESVRSLDEVRSNVRQAVLQGARTELASAWLKGLREEIPVENLLAEVRAEQAPAEEEAPADGATDEGAPEAEATPEAPAN